MFAAVMMLLAIFSGIASAAYYDEGNSGDSWETAYVLNTSSDFMLFRNRILAGSDDAGKYYKLNADIVLPRMKEWQSPHFRGHLDGNGHTLSMDIYYSDGGVFNKITTTGTDAAIRNLTLRGKFSYDNHGAGFVFELAQGIIENCTFSGTVGIGYGDAYVVAGIAHTLPSGGIIRNCTVSGTVTANVESWLSSKYEVGQKAGGIVGYLEGGLIENCTIASGATVTGRFVTGGIAAVLKNGTIRNCVVEAGANVTTPLSTDDNQTDGSVGGIAGYKSSSTAIAAIINCSSDATLSAPRWVGGIIGYAEYSDPVLSGNKFMVGAATQAIGNKTSGIAINEQNFSDDVFRSYVSSNCDTDSDGYLSDAEIAAVTLINVDGKGIASLHGVEYFSALTELICNNNQLTTLDVSQNTVLTILQCDNNQLTVLNVSYNTALSALSCDGNQLTSLDLSYNTILSGLWCSDNQLTNLDLSHNTAYLAILECYKNKLTALDVSSNTILTSLWCYSQDITIASADSTGDSTYPYSLNLSALDASFDISRVHSLDIRDSEGSTIEHNTDPSTGIISFASYPSTVAYSYDVRHPNDTQYMDVTINVNASSSPTPDPSPVPSSGVALDSSNFPDQVFRDYLTTEFDSDGDNYLSTTEIDTITSINVRAKGVSDLTGIEYLTSLTEIHAYSNDISGKLDLSANTQLTDVNLRRNSLTSIDVTANTELAYLDLDENNIVELDVTNNTKLITLDCWHNNLTELDVSKNTELTALYCGYNELTELDVHLNTKLETLACPANNISVLDVASNTALTTLWCDRNNISTLDVTMLPNLTRLECGNNKLSVLDVTRNTELADLQCEENQLTALNVSSNPLLLRLLCYGNKITTLDVSRNTSLVVLNCGDNSIPLLDLAANTHLDSDDLYLNSRINNITPNDRGKPYRTSRFSGQVLTLSKPEESGNSEYPYAINLADAASSLGVQADYAEFAASVYSVDVRDKDGNSVAYSFDPAGYSFLMADMPQSITYFYDAGYSGYEEFSYSSMDVTVNFGMKASLTPSTQTVAAGSSISPITLSVENASSSGYDVTFSELPSGLSRSDNVISGAISSAGTYTITATVMDLGDSSTVSATATITVTGGSSEVPSPSPSPSNTTNPYEPGRQSNNTNQNTSRDVQPESRDIDIDSRDIPSPEPDPVIPDPVIPDPVIPDPVIPEGSSWENPVKLSSASEFLALFGRINNGSEPAGAYYALTVDIDISDAQDWQGIGTEAHPFTGHLDGGGHTITVVISSGLFGVVSSDGIAIRTLTVHAVSTQTSGYSEFRASAQTECAGGIIRELLNGTIENCAFSGTVSAEGENSSAGGIVGELSGGRVHNCRVMADSRINAQHSAGGIVGYVYGGEITECVSRAALNAEYSGGIAGYAESERENINSNDFTQSFEVGSDASSLELTPAAQSVEEGSAVTAITFSTEGIASWSFVSEVSGLSSRDNAITGTIPYDTPAGNYAVIVNAVNSDGTRIAGQVNITVTRINRNGSRNFMDYTFEIPDVLRNGIAAYFGESEIYQLTAQEIISKTWSPERADIQAIADMNLRIVLNLPEIRPVRSGVYLMRLTLLDVDAGLALALHGITGSSEVNSSALEELEYAFFDENGREIKEVPVGKVVYAALRLSSGRTHRSVVTAPNELGLGTIQPIYPDDALMEKIAETVNLSADQLNLLQEGNILEPQEPTQAMRDEMTSRESDVVGKMNTLVVSKDGYYVFKVILSDDLYEQYVEGVKAEDLKAYVLYDNGNTEDSQVSASFITGLLNTWELLSLSGEKLEFGAKEFLMVGFLNAGTPFSVYLTKLIIALLMGGCDAGLGLSGFAVLALSAIFILRRRR